MAGRNGGGGEQIRRRRRSRREFSGGGSVGTVPVMFTLCMSRGQPHLADAHPQQNNSAPKKPVKGGYLLRYRRSCLTTLYFHEPPLDIAIPKNNSMQSKHIENLVKYRELEKQIKNQWHMERVRTVPIILSTPGGFWCKGWCEEWFILYEDSTLAWYSDKGLSRPRGCIRISDAPELLAFGEWTRKVPRRPRLPFSCHVGQLLAIGSRALRNVHWFMAQSPTEINDWMTAISNTLPPPPHLPPNNKRLSMTPLQQQDRLSNNKCQVENGVRNGVRPSSTPTNCSSSLDPTSRKYDYDYTVLSGVCIGWGHGWGWGDSSCAPQTVCAEPTAFTSHIYCDSGDDYSHSVGGYDSCDWSAFGDFAF